MDPDPAAHIDTDPCVSGSQSLLILSQKLYTRQEKRNRRINQNGNTVDKSQAISQMIYRYLNEVDFCPVVAVGRLSLSFGFTYDIQKRNLAKS